MSGAVFFVHTSSPGSYPLLLCGVLLVLCGGAACGEVRADAVVLGPTIASGGATSEDTSTAGRSSGDGGSDGGSDDDDLDAPSIAGDLCSPCTRSSECGGYKDYCLEFRDSDDRFCGEHCHTDDDCPDGYECVTLRDDSDEEQCVPENRKCPVEPR